MRANRIALLEAIVFSAEDPPTLAALADWLRVPEKTLEEDFAILLDVYRDESRGVEIRQVGRCYRMSTKPEHHEAVRAFAKSVRPRLKLSIAALETLAIVAYRGPVTVPEIQAIRGKSSGSGVLHTLARHKLITTAGRKNVIGRPIQYKTTDEFLMHFGLKDLKELPTLHDLEQLGRAELDEDERIAGNAGSGPYGPDFDRMT